MYSVFHTYLSSPLPQDYRRERWDGLLASVLLQLRECCQRVHAVKEHVALSLELSCLGQGVDAALRAAVAETALTSLCAAEVYRRVRNTRSF